VFGLTTQGLDALEDNRDCIEGKATLPKAGYAEVRGGTPAPQQSA
jgi:hypothetical protein